MTTLAILDFRGAQFTVYFQQFIPFVDRFLARTRSQNDLMTSPYTLYKYTCRFNHPVTRNVLDTIPYKKQRKFASSNATPSGGSPYKVRDVSNAYGKSREIVRTRENRERQGKMCKHCGKWSQYLDNRPSWNRKDIYSKKHCHMVTICTKMGKSKQHTAT